MLHATPFATMRIARNRLVGAGLAAALGFAASGASAASVETFTQAVGGQSVCATFAVAAPVSAIFGAKGTGLPTGGLVPCGIAGGSMLSNQAGVGPLVHASTLGPIAIASGFGSGSFTGSASASAQVGAIGAQAKAWFDGPTDAFSVTGADAYALFRDKVDMQPDALHPAGTPGTLQFAIAIDGALSVQATGAPASGDAQTVVVYQQGAGPVIQLFSAGAGSSGTFANGLATGGFNNFVTAVNPGISASVSGNAVVNTFALPFAYGTPFDFMLAVLTTTGPRARLDADADFLSTARVSGIAVFDATGAPVDGFTILAESGAIYDASGIRLAAAPVPEPAMAVLLLAGLGCVAGVRRRGRLRLA